MPRPVLLIAGGSRGIGAATARLAAEQSYDVAVNYNANANAAASVVASVKDAGGKAVAIQGHMGLEADIERVFDTAARELGPLTHFVHSAGINGQYSRLDEASADKMREVLEVDTLGALLCLRACIRRMSTKHGGKGGAVVMLSSMAASIGGANECIWYAAAKGGVHAITQSMAEELEDCGVRVNCVAPGGIDVGQRVIPRNPAALSDAEQEWKRVPRHSGLSHATASSSVNLRPSGAGVNILIRYVTRASDRLKVRNRLNERVIDVLHKPHVVISTSQPSKLTAAVLAAGDHPDYDSRDKRHSMYT